MTTTVSPSTPAASPRSKSGEAARGVGRFFSRHRRLAFGVTIAGPLGWLLVVYVGALIFLLVNAFFTLDSATQRPTTTLTAANISAAFRPWDFYATVWRSVQVSLWVTFVCLALALPTGFYLAKLTLPRTRRSLLVAMTLPLWAGYLVKAYAWRAMLQPGSKFGVSSSGGFLNSWLGFTPGYGFVGVIVTLSYLWFPFMLLPVYSGIERLPNSLLDASGDLGAKPLRTFRSVIAPMIVPSIAAGAIFTFSLSLGDYVVPTIVSDGRVQLIGNLIYRTQLAPNFPLAAAFTFWPVLVIMVFLFVMSRLGAFESL
jgi:putative spermidine/putrescine transport system permease protein